MTSSGLDNLVGEFKKNWLWKGTKLVQVGTDDGEINQLILVPASIETAGKGQLSLGCGAEGGDIPEGNYLHIKAVGISPQSKPVYNQVLVELTENSMADVRKDLLTLISDKEIVCFIKAQPDEIERFKNIEGMPEYLKKVAVTVQGNEDNIAILQ